MSTGCSRKPTVRKLERDLYLMTERLNALDSFARRAGGFLDDLTGTATLDRSNVTDYVTTAAGLVEEWKRLFPPTDDSEMEF